MGEYQFSEYAGINYGMHSTANTDLETGIRYGVIPLSAVNEYVLDSFEPDYGNASCPQCGTEVQESGIVQDLDSSERYSSFDFMAQCGVYQCSQCDQLYYPMELIADYELEDFRAQQSHSGKLYGTNSKYTEREGDNTVVEDNCFRPTISSLFSPCCLESVEKVVFKHEYEGFSAYHINSDYVCLGCKLLFPSESAYPEEPNCHTYEGEGYSLMLDSSNDIWVLKAPVATYAQFCSPCAPGACYLTNPTREHEGGFCYALDDSFFDHREQTLPESSQSEPEDTTEESTLPETEKSESTEGYPDVKAFRPYPLYHLDGSSIEDSSTLPETEDRTDFNS